MREILFRGKRLDNGKWVEGAFCPKSCDDPFGPMVDKPSIIKLGEPCDGFWYDVDPATVGQYTGLTDMQDVKIFEGDIVQFGGEYGKIEYSESEAMFQVVFDDWLTDFDHLRGTEVEVVGNVNDNTELLEG